MMDSNELKEIIKKHNLWLNDENGGVKADLRGANLREADLTEADLRGADLRGANLREADLTEADLRGADLREADLTEADLTEADLREANLRGADLRGANLREADLFDVTGNKKEIRTISIERYTINYTKDRIQIGCKNYSIDEWFAFSDEEIKRMDIGALEWWNKWKGFIKQAIELSPAE